MTTNNKVNPWVPTTIKADLKHLGKLGEEVNELGSATNRCIIQGIDEAHPITGKVNREWLEDEMADVLANIDLAMGHFGLDRERILQRKWEKIAYLSEWHNMGVDNA